MECEAREDYLRREAGKAKRYAAAEERLAMAEQQLIQVEKENEHYLHLLKKHGIDIDENET